MFFVFSFCYQYNPTQNDPFLLNQTLTKILWRVFLCQFIMLSNKFFLIRQNNQHPFLILNYNQLARANVPHDPTYTKRKIGRHTSELQSHHDLVCRLLLEKKNNKTKKKIKKNNKNQKRIQQHKHTKDNINTKQR